MRALKWAVGGLMAVGVVSASANTVGNKLEAAGQAASAALMKAQGAAVKGAKVAASGVARGARAAGSAVDKGAKKIGVPGAGQPAPPPRQAP